MAKDKKSKEKIRYHEEVIRQMLQLTTTGFGLVAALAWNDLIQTTIDEYVKNSISFGSALISKVLYAIIITSLAVGITLQLSRLLKKIEQKG